MTNVPLRTLRRIIGEGPQTRKRRRDSGQFKKLDMILHSDLVRRTIHKLYEEKCVPTIDNLRKRLIDDETGIMCSSMTLNRFVKALGFRRRKLGKRQAIKESTRLRLWRLEYLSNIQKYRTSGRSIYFLDETWFDTHDVVSFGWTDGSKNCTLDVPSNRGKRVGILHCGSVGGWVDGCLLLSAKNIKDCSLDYHQDMTAALFESWFRDTLLPKLPHNSVIVMDNASYHSRQSRKVPSSSSRKEDIQDFLLENDLFYEEHYNKKQLLEVLKTRTFKKEFVVDVMAENAGHTVLRLPPYHCELNPIEMIWSQLKHKVRSSNTSPNLDNRVIDLICSKEQEIGALEWTGCINHVLKVERQYSAFTNNQSYIIPLGNDTSESEDFSE